MVEAVALLEQPLRKLGDVTDDPEKMEEIMEG